MRKFMMKTFRLSCCAAAACLALALPAAAQSVDSIPDVVAKFDVPPRPVKTKPPVYPIKLREEGIAGAVIVSIVIDETGRVLAAEATKASHEEFRDPAIKAVREWTFAPAKVAGKPVRARVSVPLNFSVEG
jgi:protein TonB